jgi:hypothetical protein
MRRIRLAEVSACCIALSILMPAAAAATYLQQLTAVLAPVFLAENFAIVCAGRDPGFIDETRVPLGSVAAYSRHMKDEVVAGLSTDELLGVLKAAADDARRRALATLRSLDGSPDQNRVLENWCAAAAKEQVVRVITIHDRQHEAFTQAITAAKSEGTREQPPPPCNPLTNR